MHSKRPPSIFPASSTNQSPKPTTPSKSAPDKQTKSSATRITTRSAKDATPSSSQECTLARTVPPTDSSNPQPPSSARPASSEPASAAPSSSRTSNNLISAHVHGRSNLPFLLRIVLPAPTSPSRNPHLMGLRLRNLLPSHDHLILPRRRRNHRRSLRIRCLIHPRELHDFQNFRHSPESVAPMSLTRTSPANIHLPLDRLVFRTTDSSGASVPALRGTQKHRFRNPQRRFPVFLRGCAHPIAPALGTPPTLGSGSPGSFSLSPLLTIFHPFHPYLSRDFPPRKTLRLVLQ